jgi:hypothetical protein
MVDSATVRSWQGRTMVDRDGDRIGPLEAIEVDDQTGEPEWALVTTGLFGTRSTLVPVAQASPSGDQVQVPDDQQLVNDAPNLDPDGHLSEAEEQALWAHDGLGDRAATATWAGTLGVGQRGGHDRFGAGAGGRHPGPGAGPGPAAQARGHRDRAGHRAGAAVRRCGSSASRSPRPTWLPPAVVLSCRRPSRRWCCGRRSRWWTSGPCPGAGPVGHRDGDR